jgi:hypothetical protein
LIRFLYDRHYLSAAAPTIRKLGETFRMSTSDAGILIVIVLALVAIFAFLRYNQRARVKIKGPGNIGLDLEASNDPAPRIVIEDAKSHRGGLRAEEGTGSGVQVRRVEVDQDIQVTTHSRDHDPKA